jgi:hypothetical protein
MTPYPKRLIEVDPAHPAHLDARVDWWRRLPDEGGRRFF